VTRHSFYKGEPYVAVEYPMRGNASPFFQTCAHNGIGQLAQTQQDPANAHPAAHVEKASGFCIHRSLKDRSLECLSPWIRSPLMKSDRIREGGS
jgi:hypothetical protein